MILLDRNILIYATRPEYPAVRDFVAKADASVSIVSKIEVLGILQVGSLGARGAEPDVPNGEAATAHSRDR